MSLGKGNRSGRRFGGGEGARTRGRGGNDGRMDRKNPKKLTFEWKGRTEVSWP